MIDYSNSKLSHVSVHAVGNKTNGEGLYLSENEIDISNVKLTELMNQFFINPFTLPEFYSFTFSNEDFKLNPLYIFASQVFDNQDALHKNSVHIAKLLFELSVHPQIKSGDLFVAYFTDLLLEDELLDAVGIFKSENKQAFLKLDNQNTNFLVQPEEGINIEKLDKGCLIFNTNRDHGYKICNIDKSNRTFEAQYWKDNFLQIKSCSDDFHYTKEFMNITKNFVTKQLKNEHEVSKADQIDLLIRSVNYFKSNETFDKNDFEKEVFQNPDVITAFQNFDSEYREKHDINIQNNFEISEQAVKKQARVFKSVLKLDSNFHVYIHGNRDLIEQGMEPNGRKFYKIYFEKEA